MTARAYPRLRYVIGAAAAVILGLAGWLGSAVLAGPAQAHDWLVSSEPANGAVLTTLPDQFSVTANEPLLDLGGESGGFAMLVIGPDGLYYGDGCVSIQDATMSTDAALGPAGAYTLDWQLVSTDSHSVSEKIPFHLAADSRRCRERGVGDSPDLRERQRHSGRGNTGAERACRGRPGRTGDTHSGS